MGKMQKRNSELSVLVVDLYNELHSGNAIAKKLGLSPPTVYRMLHDAEISVPDWRDPKPSRRKLTQEKESELVSDYVSGMAMPEMLSKYSVSNALIREAVKRAGNKVRKVGGSKKEISIGAENTIVSLYKDGLTRGQICVKLKCGYETVSRVLNRSGIFSRTHKAGKDHPQWQGGKTKTPDGYIKELMDHDDKFRSMGGRNGYVFQHRIVIARSIGRILERHETVHHINGDRSDNRLENLQLRVGKHGKGQRFICNSCGSCDIVSTAI